MTSLKRHLDKLLALVIHICYGPLNIDIRIQEVHDFPEPPFRQNLGALPTLATSVPGVAVM